MAAKHPSRKLFELNTGETLEAVNERLGVMARFEQEKMMLLAGMRKGMSASSEDEGGGAPFARKDKQRPIVEQSAPFAIAGETRPLTKFSYSDFVDMANEDDERFRNTLAKLRSSGYCNERTLKDLEKRAAQLSGPHGVWRSDMEQAIFIEHGYEKVRNAYEKNRDDVWISAIREIVLQFFIDNMISVETRTYTYQVKSRLGELYEAAISVAARIAWWDQQKKDAEEKAKWRAKYEAKREELKQHKKKVESIYEDAKAEAEAKVKARQDELIRENADLHRQIAALEKKLEKLTPAAGQESKPGSDFPVPAAEEDVQETLVEEAVQTDVPEFPENAVFFLGGHTILQNKMKQRHPEWTCMSTEDERRCATFRRSGSKLSVLLIWQKHLSHKMYNAMMDYISGTDTPYFYLESTNVDALESEIEAKWKDYWAKKQARAS